MKSAIIGGVIAAVLCLLAFTAAHVVPAGHKGVLITFGDVDPRVVDEGLHFFNPVAHVKDVDVRLDVAKADSQGGTKDLQPVSTQLTVNYRLDSSKVPYIYKEYGLDVENKLINPIMSEMFKAITARYTSEELVTKRAIVSGEIRSGLLSKLAPYGINIAEVNITNFAFSAGYMSAVEEKVKAEQLRLKAVSDLERIKVEAQQSIERAKAEAASLELQKQAVTPGLIELRKQENQREAIKKWNGVLPVTVLGGDSTPMISINK